MIVASSPESMSIEDHYQNGANTLGEISTILGRHLASFSGSIHEFDRDLIIDVIINADYLRNIMKDIGRAILLGVESNFDFREYLFEIIKELEGIDTKTYNQSTLSIFKVYKASIVLERAIEYYHSGGPESISWFRRVLFGRSK